MALLPSLVTLPHVQFRKNPSFYLRYDGGWLLVFLAAHALISLTHWKGLVTEVTLWSLVALPFICYAQILCSVFIHNASHGNFPKPVNRVLGEIFGLIVLTRFASWEIVHQRHHQYSDDRDKDPHPLESSYWRYVWKTIVKVEEQLQAYYFELWGKAPEVVRREKIRVYVSYATGIALIALWYRFLGPLGFFVFFVPASVIGILHLIHFNWTTHNALSGTTNFHPVNLDEGFFKYGNLAFFGIYMHENHHKRVNLFNPAKWRPKVSDARLGAAPSDDEGNLVPVTAREGL